MNPMSHVEASNHSFPSGANLNLNCSGEKNSYPNWKLPSTTTEATYLAFNVKLPFDSFIINVYRTKNVATAIGEATFTACVVIHSKSNKR